MELPRILIIGMHYAPEPSGNAPYTTALACGLVRRGYHVEVITGVPHYPAWSISEGYDSWRTTALEDGVGVTRLRHYVTGNPTAGRRALMELTFGIRAAAAARPGPAVFICVSPALLASALVAERARSRWNRPAIGLWIQDLYSQGLMETRQLGPWIGRRAAWFEGTVARRCDGVAVVHSRFKELAVTKFGLPPERVDVLRNWTHLPDASRANVAIVRDRLGWRAGETVALHAGNMGVKQGLTNVLDAAAIAHRQGSSVRFVFLGGGNQLQVLQSRAAGLPNVEFLSSLPTDQFAQTLAAADVLLVNERLGVKEMSVPSKLTSYYTSGRPVVGAVASDSVSAAEIELSGAGVRVEPDDPSALLQAVEQLGRNTVQADLHGTSGLRFYRKNLDESAALDRFEVWVSKLIATRGPTGLEKQ